MEYTKKNPLKTQPNYQIKPNWYFLIRLKFDFISNLVWFDFLFYIKINFRFFFYIEPTDAQVYSNLLEPLIHFKILFY